MEILRLPLRCRNGFQEFSERTRGWRSADRYAATGVPGACGHGEVLYEALSDSAPRARTDSVRLPGSLHRY